MSNSKQIYVFLGLPASGKGTQIERLARDEDLCVIAIGDLIRSEIERDKTNDPFWVEIKKRYDEGVPQRDEIVVDVVKRAVANTAKGLIFDNFPFSLNQAKHFDRLISELGWERAVIIYLNVAPETAIKRVTKRKICAECGKVYIGSEGQICEECGGALISRADDNEDTARERISHYVPRIREVIDYYRMKLPIIEIDGEPTVQEVSSEIKRALAKLKEKNGQK